MRRGASAAGMRVSVMVGRNRCGSDVPTGSDSETAGRIPGPPSHRRTTLGSAASYSTSARRSPWSMFSAVMAMGLRSTTGSGWTPSRR